MLLPKDFIELILILCVSVLIYYFRKKATNLADKEDIAEITQEIESVKSEFSHKVEVLKASLGRDNISFQIHTAEYIRLRFQRLDELFLSLYDVMNYCRYEFSPSALPHPLEPRRNGYIELKNKSEDCLYRSAMYIEDGVRKPVLEFIEKCDRIEATWRRMNTSHQLMVAANKAGKTDQVEAHQNTNFAAVDQLDKAIGSLSALLDGVRIMFKSQLETNKRG